jgi:uncharacterized protein (DUF362 family)
VERASSCLVTLAGFLMPHVSLIDGFLAMQGDGPRNGSRVPLGTVIAGTDAVAVDAVAASIMGFEPMNIGYLRQAHALGLGTADLSSIQVIGDADLKPRRLRRHSSDRLLRLAGSRAARPASASRPHFGRAPAPQASQAAR